MPACIISQLYSRHLDGVSEWVTLQLALEAKAVFMPAGDWSLLRQVECSTADLAGLAWSPSRDWSAGIFPLFQSVQYRTFFSSVADP
jgi:hypothetical protein